MRAFLGIIIGLAVALGIQTSVEFISSQFFPYAPFDMLDRARGAEVLGSRPAAANLLGILGYFTAALAGGYASRRIARRDWAAWVPAGLLAFVAAVFALHYSLTGWGQAGAFVAALVGGLIAHNLGPAGNGTADADGPGKAADA